MGGWRALAVAGWAALVAGAALGLFARGFLLTRVELPHRSACRDPPGPPSRLRPPAAPARGCWAPRRFARAALLLLDALRFDFARHRPGPGPASPFLNRLPVLRDLAGAGGGPGGAWHGRLFRFRADPPTTTMQRLKALMTGALPTFVDAGSNFASHAVREDNLLGQLGGGGGRALFMGDDTWAGLFPGAFARARFLPSFNVKDLHSVDDAILRHLYHDVDSEEWDLLIAHFLGVDHCGHKHGPDHPEMAKKLSQMDTMLRSLVDHLANDTLLIVAGDHGMTSTGDHGGDSEEEVDAALFLYSKAPLFWDPPPEEPETVPQVNLVPTLALLLGLPIPYNNIGEVMGELFAVEGDAAASGLAQLAAYSINARQVNRFLHSYSLAAQDLPAEKLQRLQEQFSSTVEDYERLLARAGPPLLPEVERLRSRFRRYLREARAVCAETWARFQPACMVAGCALLASSCLLCWLASQAASASSFSYRHLLCYPLLWGLAGAAVLGLAHLWGWAGLDFLLVSAWAAAASQCGFFWHCWARRPWRSRSAGAPLPSGGGSLRQRLWAQLGPALPLGLLLARCGAMLSDSFVVAEDRVAPFLLASLALLLVARLHWEGRLDDSPASWRLLGWLGVVLACARLSGLFRQCREETPVCQSSPLLAPLSSVQDPRAKNFCYLLCVAVLVALAGGVRAWLRHYGNLNSPSAPVLFVRWGLPLVAVCIAGYWAVASGAEEALVKAHAWVQLALVAFPRSVFVLVAAGLLLLLWDPVTVFVQDGRSEAGTGGPILLPSSQEELRQVIPQLYRRMQESLKSRLQEEDEGETARAGGRATVAAYGLGSVYSAALLICLALLGFLFLALHSERLSLAFLLLFLEAYALLGMRSAAVALASPADPFAVPWEALIGWALASAQFFYATGHQPVFPAIHWNAAFVGFQQGHDANLMPALLVGANTFASHILFAVGCPLLLLWPFLCETPGSRSKTPKSGAGDGEEQLMEMRLREAPERFSVALLQLGLKYLLVLGLQMLACVLAAMILRRHLMVWKVFAPKFLFETLGFAVSSLFLLVGIGLVVRVDGAVSRWFKQVILAQPRMELWAVERKTQEYTLTGVVKAAGWETQSASECQHAFSQLLQKIQGLPAVLPALPLELAILCNSLQFDLAVSSASNKELLAKIDHGLSRVLEARALPGHGLSSEDRWRKVLQQGTPEELQGPLHQLAALQCLLWLAGNHLSAVEGLCRQLCGAKDPGLPSSHSSCENELLSLLQGWRPADVGESGPLVVQSARDLKDVLWTSAAFLQGFQELGAGNHAAALASLQAAATGLCGKRVLARIFVLMGCCHLKRGKPQTAIQCLKQALQVDTSFVPALYQAALLYRHLGLAEAELEALALLNQALHSLRQTATAFLNPTPLVGVERFVCTPQLHAFFGQTSPSEAKYLLAQRCLQEGRAKEAAEHYLDLLTDWQEGPLHQVLKEWLPQYCRLDHSSRFMCRRPLLTPILCRAPFSSMPGFLHGELALPRVPEVFLEAASALEEVGRHEDAILVCEEVVGRTSQLVPKRLQVDLGSSAQEESRGALGASLAQQERESLRCVLWRAAAYLLQGCARARLGEAKEAISLSSRCLQDLLRIQFVNTGSQGSEEDGAPFAPTEAEVLRQIRHMALTVRGAEFLELGREKEALMDFQHSLHFCPESPAAHWYLLHTLWKLDRRQEAQAHWRRFHANPGLVEEEAKRTDCRNCLKREEWAWAEVPPTLELLQQESPEQLKVVVGRFVSVRPSPQYLRLCRKWMAFPHMESLAQNLETGLVESRQEP
ncbi:UNVERIFIED_CONTAM: hypothetical protein K2H54_068252 [Gekko kuhli]